MRLKGSGEAFVQHLLAAMPNDPARLRLAAALMAYEGCTVYLPATRKADRRLRAAANMLANHMTGPEVADAIRQRFGVSRRTAERDVSAARKMSESLVATAPDHVNSATMTR